MSVGYEKLETSTTLSDSGSGVRGGDDPFVADADVLARSVTWEAMSKARIITEQEYGMIRRIYMRPAHEQDELLATVRSFPFPISYF